MAEPNDIADVQFPQPQAPEIAPGLPDVQQGEPAAQPPAIWLTYVCSLYIYLDVLCNIKAIEHS